jgi:hypothetical protein
MIAKGYGRAWLVAGLSSAPGLLGRPRRHRHGEDSTERQDPPSA